MTIHLGISPSGARRRSACRARQPFRIGMPFGVALSLLAGTALAQNYQQVAPNTPAPQAAPASGPASPPPAKLPRGDQQIVPALKGLVFVDGASKVRPAGIATQGVDAAGIAVLDQPDFNGEIAPYIGKPLNFDRLNEIQRLVIAQYRNNDRPLVDVAVPEQNVESGSIQIVVTEFHAGTVTAEGNKYFSSEQLTDAVRVKQGETIRASTLIDDVNWLNENPFRQVDIVYRKDLAPDTTDIVLRTADRFPVRIYGGYDNTGTPLTGRSRWNLGFNWGNALWLDQLFSYQFTSSSDFWTGAPTGQRDANFMSHSVDWVIPLPWRDKIEIFGAYQQSVPRLGPDLGELGVSGQASIRYVLPLPHLWGLKQEVRVGYDFKTTNNNLAFGGQTVSAISTDIHQFMASDTATYADPWGTTTAVNTFTFSPGGFSSDNEDAAFGISEPFAKAEYFYWNIAVDRQTPLPWNFVWALHIQGQLASGNLLPSEQLGAGGAGLVRGYNTRAVNGDEGVLVSNELRSRAFHLLPDAYNDQFQFFVFFDYATLHDVKAPGNQPNGGTLASVGPGLHYTIDRYIDLKADAGFQLRGTPTSKSTSELVDISLTVSY